MALLAYGVFAMFKIWFSVVFAWSFVWRLGFLLGLLSYVQLQIIRCYVNANEFQLKHFVIISIFSSIMCFIPFVMTVYWMLVRGVMWKITKRFSIDYDRKIVNRKMKKSHFSSFLKRFY